MKEVHDRYPSVHVAFPEPGRRSNTVTLRGPSEEVKQCKRYMEKHAKDVVSGVNTSHLLGLLVYWWIVCCKKTCTCTYIV